MLSNRHGSEHIILPHTDYSTKLASSSKLSEENSMPSRHYRTRVSETLTDVDPCLWKYILTIGHRDKLLRCTIRSFFLSMQLVHHSLSLVGVIDKFEISLCRGLSSEAPYITGYIYSVPSPTKEASGWNFSLPFSPWHKCVLSPHVIA